MLMSLYYMLVLHSCNSTHIMAVKVNAKLYILSNDGKPNYNMDYN